jgi:hypothetical protein
MRGGVCIAGMTKEPDPVTGLRWVRPRRDFGHVLLGDITTAEGTVLRPFDVVQFEFLRAKSDPPHTEDWVVDFVRNRPRIVRRLEGERRTRFLRKYLDTAPQQVLEGQLRSLCLIRPDSIKGCYRLDSFSGKYEVRMAFELAGRRYTGSYAKGGISVTDLKWRALGRAWLPENGGWTDFEAGDLEARYGIQEVYLVVGLARNFEGKCWPLIVGVHTVPDYEANVDYDDL